VRCREAAPDESGHSLIAVLGHEHAAAVEDALERRVPACCGREHLGGGTG
jgi:hypothetical protein